MVHKGFRTWFENQYGQVSYMISEVTYFRVQIRDTCVRSHEQLWIVYWRTRLPRCRRISGRVFRTRSRPKGESAVMEVLQGFMDRRKVRCTSIYRELSDFRDDHDGVSDGAKFRLLVEPRLLEEAFNISYGNEGVRWVYKSGCSIGKKRETVSYQ